MTAQNLHYLPGNRKRFLSSFLCNPQADPPAGSSLPPAHQFGTCPKCGQPSKNGVCVGLCGASTACPGCGAVKQPDRSWRRIEHDEHKALPLLCPDCEKKTVIPPETTFFAVLMIGVGVFGVGRTRQAAIEAAQKLFALNGSPLDLPAYSQRMPRGVLCITRCARRFAEAVEESGGAAGMPFTINGEGLLDLPDDPGSDSSAERLGQAIGNLSRQVEEVE